ncbi:hypothetical protein M405DRAFT_815306 [Rhizopogon salebrosus TDB-379]|nr:hypothetical protein M405DRAFT_815306 [Rhizopogon salebrosus TDB-379]
MNQIVLLLALYTGSSSSQALPSHVSIHFPSCFSPSSSSSMRPVHVTPWILGVALLLVQGDCTPYLCHCRAVRARGKRKRYVSSTSMPCYMQQSEQLNAGSLLSEVLGDKATSGCQWCLMEWSRTFWAAGDLQTQTCA